MASRSRNADKPSHGDIPALPKTGTEIVPAAVRRAVSLRYAKPGEAPVVETRTVKTVSEAGAIEAAITAVFGTRNPRGLAVLRVISVVSETGGAR